jgi:hypothetical protein
VITIIYLRQCLIDHDVLVILSAIHTIALTVRVQRQQPWSYTWTTNVFYPSGIGALVPLFVLCVFSLPFIRRRWYEAFFLVHFIAAIFFLYWMTNHGINLSIPECLCD